MNRNRTVIDRLARAGVLGFMLLASLCGGFAASASADPAPEVGGGPAMHGTKAPGPVPKSLANAPIGQAVAHDQLPSVALAPSDTTAQSINFTEFPVGTQITNQYANKGVVFSAGAFITNDATYNNQPVLSGTPQFNGPITVTFVTPGNASEVTTATNVSFTSGYYDNLNSTQIVWYDINGHVLGQKTNTGLGFQPNTLPGAVARFTITIIGNEPAGFALDTLAFTTGASSFSLLDANYEFTVNEDLSDANVSSIVPANVVPYLVRDTHVVTGAVADGATKVLLMYTASAPGTVTFTETNGFGSDVLRKINSTGPPTNVATIANGGKNYAFAVYTVPPYIIGGQKTSVTFSAVFTPNGGSAASPITLPLSIQQPPVLLVHGLWADSTSWERSSTGTPFTTGTYHALKNATPAFDVWLLDYSNAQANSLKDNVWSIRVNPVNTDAAGGKVGGLDAIRRLYNSDGIAITRVDVVAHGLGGLLAREYFTNRSYKSRYNFEMGDIRRLITIGTPHYGTQVATAINHAAQSKEYGPAIRDYLHDNNFPLGNSMRDLQTGSQAIIGLGATNVLANAEAGIYTSGDMGVFEVIDNMLKLAGQNVTWPVPSDLFSGAVSQEGGLPPSNSKEQQSLVYTNEQSNDAIGTDIAALLVASDSAFASAGFPKPVASYPYVRPAGHAAKPPAAHATLKHHTSPTPFITFTSPTAASTVYIGTPLNVAVAPTAGETIQSMVVTVGTPTAFVGSHYITQAPWSANFDIPTALYGACPVTVLAQDTSGNACTLSETVYIAVQYPAYGQQITVTPTLCSFDNIGSQQQIYVSAPFSDGPTRDLTFDPGTTYTSDTPAVASVSSTGLVTALANGTASIRVTSYNGYYSNVAVIIAAQAPMIDSVSPNAVAIGTSSITLTGYDLGGATQVQAFNNGVLDPKVTFSGIAVDPNGSTLNCTVTVASGTAAGTRILEVTAAGGTSILQAPADAAGLTVAAPTPTPTIGPNGGTFSAAQSVTLTDSNVGASIYYSEDGSTPSPDSDTSTLYTAPFMVSGSETVKAMAVADGLAYSAVASAAFTLPAPAPTISPNGGTSAVAQSVTLSDTLDGAAIYYTIDGSTPTPASTLYTAPITVTSSETINAIAVATGYANSPVATATFTINVMSYVAGIQMISLPYAYPSTALAALFGYASPVMAVWNPATSVYSVSPTPPADKVLLGQGYWIRFPSAITIAQVGNPAPAGTLVVVTLHTGWNMIGDPWPASTPLSSCTFAGGTKTYAQAESSPGQLIGPAYGYSTSTHAYFVASSLDPGQGFWLYSFGDTDMSIPPPGP